MLKEIRCLVVICDTCGEQVQDDDRGVEHYGSVKEIVQHLGGIYDGEVYPSPSTSGMDFGILLADGTYHCSTCKLEQHDFIPGQLLAQSCARCGRLDDNHDSAELPPADVIGQGALLADVPLRPPARPGDVNYCREACGREWTFPGDDFPEPEDGARLEFEYATDRYAVWRDVSSSVRSGWPAESSWCFFGGDVPHTWECLLRMFGPAIRQGTRLYPATQKG
jgi:hypothetical protein